MMIRTKRTLICISILLLIAIIAILILWHNSRKTDDIIQAIKTGDVKAVKKYIDNGDLQVNSLLGRSKMTPLTYAVDSNKVEMVKLLLQEGASVTLRGRKGEVPIRIVQSESFVDQSKLMDAQVEFMKRRKFSQEEIDKFIASHIARHKERNSTKSINERKQIKKMIEDAYEKEKLPPVKAELGPTTLNTAMISNRIAELGKIAKTLPSSNVGRANLCEVNCTRFFCCHAEPAEASVSR